MSVIIIVIQLFRKDTIIIDFTKNDWETVITDDSSEATLTIKLPHDFQQSPVAVLKKKDTGFKLVCVEQQFSQDGTELKLIININKNEPDMGKFDGRITIGSPIN